MLPGARKSVQGQEGIPIFLPHAQHYIIGQAHNGEWVSPFSKASGTGLLLEVGY